MDHFWSRNDGGGTFRRHDRSIVEVGENKKNATEVAYGSGAESDIIWSFTKKRFWRLAIRQCLCIWIAKCPWDCPPVVFLA